MVLQKVIMKFFKFGRWLVNKIDTQTYIVLYFVALAVSFLISAFISNILPALIVAGSGGFFLILSRVSGLIGWVRTEWGKFNEHEDREAEKIISRLRGER